MLSSHKWIDTTIGFLAFDPRGHFPKENFATHMMATICPAEGQHSAGVQFIVFHPDISVKWFHLELVFNLILLMLISQASFAEECQHLACTHKPSIAFRWSPGSLYKPRFSGNQL